MSTNLLKKNIFWLELIIVIQINRLKPKVLLVFSKFGFGSVGN